MARFRLLYTEGCGRVATDQLALLTIVGRRANGDLKTSERRRWLLKERRPGSGTRIV